MEKLFHLTVFSQDRILHEGEVSTVLAPGELGYMGILAHHAPLVSCLRPGRVEWKEPGGPKTILESKAKGLVEVFKNKVILILDEAVVVREKEGMGAIKV